MTAAGARAVPWGALPHGQATAPARSPGFHLAVLAVFLSPMNYLRTDIIYFTASDVAVVMALAVMLWQGALPRRPFGGATGLWLAGFLMLGTGLMLGSIAHAAGVDLGKVMAQYAFSLLLVPLVVAGRSLAETVVLARALVLSIVVVMLFGMWMIHVVPDPPLSFVSHNNRMRSLVERENECAAMGAVGLVFLLGLWQAGLARLWELLVALPIGILAARHPGRVSRIAERAAFLAHGLPGVVVGLSLVFLGVSLVPALYQTTWMVAFAYATLFLPLAVTSVAGAVAQSSPALEEAARSLGSSGAEVLRRVTLPLALPGVGAGVALVALTAMKELPATLLLRPTGMDTLATRLWNATSVGRYAEAAPYALTLVLLAAVPTWVVVHRTGIVAAVRGRSSAPSTPNEVSE